MAKYAWFHIINDDDGEAAVRLTDWLDGKVAARKAKEEIIESLNGDATLELHQQHERGRLKVTVVYEEETTTKEPKEPEGEVDHTKGELTKEERSTAKVAKVSVIAAGEDIIAMENGQAPDSIPEQEPEPEPEPEQGPGPEPGPEDDVIPWDDEGDDDGPVEVKEFPDTWDMHVVTVEGKNVVIRVDGDRFEREYATEAAAKRAASGLGAVLRSKKKPRSVANFIYSPK